MRFRLGSEEKGCEFRVASLISPELLTFKLSNFSTFNFSTFQLSTFNFITFTIKMTKRFIPILLIITLFSVNLFSQDIPPRPNPPRLVNDLAGVLDEQTERALEWNLRALNDSTSNQIVVLTVKTLNGHDPASFAYEVGEKWQVGQKDFDNGIVVLIKTKVGSSRGQAFIAVGYGLEGIVPDAIAVRIVNNEMIPFFKNNDYETGIVNGVIKLSQLVSGEISADGYNKSSKPAGIFGFLPFIIIIIIILLIRVSNARSRSVGSKGSSIPFWTALWLGSSLGSGSHSGNWGGFSGGSGGFGGGGGGFGGGFGGFGGGSFGGGGAGGSW